MGSLDLDDLQEKNDERLRQLKSLAGLMMFTAVEFSHTARKKLLREKGKLVLENVESGEWMRDIFHYQKWFGSVLNLPIMGFASGLGPGPRGLSSTSRSAQGQKIVTLNLTSKSSGHGLKSIPAMLK